MGFPPLILVIALVLRSLFLLAGNDGDSRVSLSNLPGNQLHSREKDGESCSISPTSQSHEHSKQNGARFPAEESLGASELTSRHSFLVSHSIQRIGKHVPTCDWATMVDFRSHRGEKGSPSSASLSP